MPVGLSDIVLSLSGHDKGSLYIVKAASGGQALLCDGKRRRLSNPKRKSLRHLEKRGKAVLRDGATDREIRTALAVFKSEEGTRLGEG